jgi:hypothetical protein
VSDEDIISKGRQAGHELRVTGEAFDKLRQALIDRMVLIPATERDEIMSAHMAVQILDKVKRTMMAVVDDGRIAEAVRDKGLTS